jgi:hypothetical protein
VYQRPGERTTTSKILDDLVGKTLPEKQSDSLVTSSPSGYVDNKLQQQRVISATYAIREDARGEDIGYVSQPQRTDYKVTETNWQDYKTTGGLSDINNIGKPVPQSFTEEDYKIDANKYTTSQYETTKYETTTAKYDGGVNFKPTEDGKSSAEFLAFLSEIKSGRGSES